MNDLHTETKIQETPLSFVKKRHLVRSINESYVDQLVRNIKKVAVKAFPLSATQDNIEKATWKIIGATFQGVAPRQEGGVAPEFGATAPFTLGIVQTFQPAATCVEKDTVTAFVTTVTFTENLLREIVPLIPGQQVELVQSLSSGKIQKNRFKTLAQNCQAHNDAAIWVLAGIDILNRYLAEVDVWLCFTHHAAVQTFFQSNNYWPCLNGFSAEKIASIEKIAVLGVCHES
ncbi:MAG: hypothetical protein HQL74_08130 [Magnetococcales bacterium]|nr:hypothetical protein [Magnetococcales bacterium]